MFGRQTLPVREVGGGGGPVGRLLCLGAAGPGTEDGEEDRQEEQSMEEAESDDQENHLEEGDEDVGWSNHETHHPQHGGDGALQYGQPQAVQTVPHSVVRAALAVQVVVGDVSGEVNREPEITITIKGRVQQTSNSALGYLPNTHDQVYHGDGVKVDAPECHEAEHSNFDGDDREGDPQRADGVGDEDEGHDHHHAGRDGDTLDGGGENHQKLKHINTYRNNSIMFVILSHHTPRQTFAITSLE